MAALGYAAEQLGSVTQKAQSAFEAYGFTLNFTEHSRITLHWSKKTGERFHYHDLYFTRRC